MDISLTQRLAEHGFVSNIDYTYPLQCLLSAKIEGIRCLNLEGDCAKYRAAFAYALGAALEYPRLLYHEMTPPSPPPLVLIPSAYKSDEMVGEPALDPLNQIMIEACALSEAEPTLLILDQLHIAPFAEHLRLSHFLRTAQWSYNEIRLQANASNLLLVLIADVPLYHGLQNPSFRLWLTSDNPPLEHLSADTLGLPPSAQELIDGLKRLFAAMGVHPTLTEWQRLVHDVLVNVNGIEELRISLYGWIEAIDRTELYAVELIEMLDEVLQLLRDSV